MIRRLRRSERTGVSKKSLVKNFPIAVMLVLVLTSSSLAEKMKFSQPPVVSWTGDSVQIAFAVSEPPDVEVAVLNARG